MTQSPVAFLNNLLLLDRDNLKRLVEFDVNVNERVSESDYYDYTAIGIGGTDVITVLGLINGLLDQLGQPRIAAVYGTDKHEELLRFQQYTQHLKPNESLN